MIVIKAEQWVNLHRHSMASIFDGFGRHEDAAEHAKNLGQKALGLTDHGRVSGLMGHYRACKDADIKPILGAEVYFQPEFNSKTRSFHLILLAKNYNGFQNILKLHGEAIRNAYFRRPILDDELIFENSKDMICCSLLVESAWRKVQSVIVLTLSAMLYATNLLTAYCLLPTNH